ncbi:hypothetical protein Ocin01_14910 [Orchesella cincta]|uniref:Uncharacterized protein n=1 Tax=Orchesella cincta TaxID=48709 RepID=A0A1D2MFL3_ORCCI|nr:hypothetical protein Ocin01_14910 [Orchesella cincta]
MRRSTSKCPILFADATQMIDLTTDTDFGNQKLGYIRFRTSASGLPFGDIFNSATSSFSKIGNDVGKTFQDGASQAGNGVVDAASVVGNGIHHAGGSIVDAANTVGKSLTDVFNVPLNFMKGVFAWLAEWIMPLLFGLAAIASVVVVLCFLCYAKSICDMCSISIKSMTSHK